MTGPTDTDTDTSSPLAQLTAAVRSTMNACTTICTLQDVPYWQSFPEIRSSNATTEHRLLRLVNKLASYANPTSSTADKPLIKTSDDDQQRLQCLVENVDVLLERVDVCLDLVNSSPEDIALAEQAKQKARAALSRRSASNGSIRNEQQQMPKPQLKFGVAVDNSPTTVFVPRIRHKPHAIEPLPLYEETPLLSRLQSPQLTPALQSHVDALGLSSSPFMAAWPHPYAAELAALRWTPAQLGRCKVQMFLPLKETPCDWIDSVDQLTELVAALQLESEIAIDLEHHDYRSYLGFTCLMQISTRNHDYLVDALVLRDHLHVLNEVTADPAILKVLHGADRDVLWLQRDFGVYLVNMFDTGQAARVLDLPRFSLQHLLHHYADVALDKAHQLSDWRQRPLLNDMMVYARMDTHYLLYLSDRMRNELSNRSAVKGGDCVKTVLDRSRRLCLQVYAKPVLTPLSHKSLLARNKVVLSRDQEAVFMAVFAFRDDLARRLDESGAYVIAAADMVKIARAMPPTKQALLKACPNLRPVVKQRVEDLVTSIAASLSNRLPEMKLEEPAVEETPNDGSFDEVFVDEVVPMLECPSLKDDASQEAIEDLEAPPLSTAELYQQCVWVQADDDASRNPPQLAAKSASMFDLHESDSSEDSDDLEERRRKVASVRMSLSSIPEMSGFVLPQPKADAEAVDDDRDEEVPETAPVPQSLSEIYQMSNENRRRNKEKKKFKAAVSVPVAEEDQLGLPEPSVGNADDQLDTSDFMKSIGWMNSDDDDLVEEHKAQATSSRSSVEPSTTSSAASQPQQKQRRRRRGAHVQRAKAAAAARSCEAFSYAAAAGAAAAAAAEANPGTPTPANRRPFAPYSSAQQQRGDRSQHQSQKRRGTPGRYRGAASITSSSAKSTPSRSRI